MRHKLVLIHLMGDSNGHDGWNIDGFDGVYQALALVIEIRS